MSLYDKFSCSNKNDQCNYIKPFSKLEFQRNNPVTGNPFSEDEVNSIATRFFKSCTVKKGTIDYCCDPFGNGSDQVELSEELREKYPHIRINRNNLNQKITSIDVCGKSNIAECPGGDWKKPSSYDICKLESGSRIIGDKGVDTITNLKQDCFVNSCNPQELEVTLANFINDAVNETGNDYYDDRNMMDVIKLNNVMTMIDTYMPKIKDINRPMTHNDSGNTMLHECINHNADKIMNMLIARGANLNVKNIVGDTPLHIASRRGQINMVYALINYGANVNPENNIGETPIFGAIKDSTVEILKILFNNGGDIYHINNDGNSLLHICIMYSGRDKVAKCRFLIESGLDIELKNKKGETPMSIAKRMTNSWYSIKNTHMNNVNNNVDLNAIKKSIEGFDCQVSKVVKYKETITPDIPEVLSYLNKALYLQHKNEYNDFVEGDSKYSHIELQKGVCLNTTGRVSDKEILNNQNIQSREECESMGNVWREYGDNTKVKSKTDYLNDNVVDDLTPEDLYVEKCREPVPLVDLDSLFDTEDGNNLVEGFSKRMGNKNPFKNMFKKKSKSVLLILIMLVLLVLYLTMK